MEPMDGNVQPVLTDEEQRRTAVTYLRTLDARIGIVENLLLELLMKLKDAGLIADIEDEDEDEGKEQSEEE